MYFRILLAGTVFGIGTIHGNTYRMCADYLTDDMPETEIAIAPEDIQTERKISAANDIKEGRKVVNFSDGYLETLAVYRRICDYLAGKNVILFHSSALAVDGRGYLFAAPSGTGKSTHARLWREAFGSRVTVINDDKPLLKISADEIRVYGTPWNGKHHLGVNASVPVQAICFIERGRENEITELESGVFEKLLAQTYRPGDAGGLMKVVGLVGEMAGRLKFYRLKCNMDIEAAYTAYGGMAPEEKK